MERFFLVFGGNKIISVCLFIPWNPRFNSVASANANILLRRFRITLMQISSQLFSTHQSKVKKMVLVESE